MIHFIIACVIDYFLLYKRMHKKETKIFIFTRRVSFYFNQKRKIALEAQSSQKQVALVVSLHKIGYIS